MSLFVHQCNFVHKIRLHVRDSVWQGVSRTFDTKFCSARPASCHPFEVLGACDRPVMLYPITSIGIRNRQWIFCPCKFKGKQGAELASVP